MPLVYAAVVPHSPLLVSAMAKENRRLVAATYRGFRIIDQEIHARQAEVLVILTPHGPSLPPAFSIDVADQYRGSLTEFGNVEISLHPNGITPLAHRMKEVAEATGIPIVLQTADQLDYGSVVPLHLLSQTGKTIRILPVSVAGQEPSNLLRFGSFLSDFFHQIKERAALLASADLSRRPDQAASGYRPTGNEQLISQAINRNDPSLIVDLQSAPPICGLPPILTLLAVTQSLPSRSRIIGWQAPFGIGLMTAGFDIPS